MITNRITLLLLLIAGYGFSATATWTGSSNKLMLNPNNWNPPSVPSHGDYLIFPANERLNVFNNIPNLSVGNITISDLYNFNGGPFIIASPRNLTFTVAQAEFSLNAILEDTWNVFCSSGGNLMSGNIQDIGGLNLASGTLYLSGNNSYIGDTVINGDATLFSNVSVALSNFSSINILTGGSLVLGPDVSCTIKALNGAAGSFANLQGSSLTITDTSSFSGTIQGPGSLSLSNSATLNFSGTTVITGHPNLYLEGGTTIDLGNTSPSFEILSGAGNILLGTGTISTTAGESVFSGSISGSGGFSALGGLQTLTGSNMYTGVTTIGTNSTLTLTTAGFGTSSGLVVNSGSVLQAEGSLTIAVPVTLNGNWNIDPNNQQITISGPIGPGNYEVLIQPTYSQSLGGTVFFTGANTYTGPTLIFSGTLNITSLAIGNTSQFGLTSLSESSPVLQAGESLTIPVPISGSGVIDANGYSMSISGDISADNLTFGSLSGPPGTVLLTNASNTISNMTVQSGTLQAGTTGAFGSNLQTDVLNGATLNFQTFNNTVGTLSNMGFVATAATVNTNSYTQSSGASLTLNVPTAFATPSGNIVSSGPLNLAGSLTVTNTGGFVPTASTELVLLQGTLLNGRFSSSTASGFGAQSHFSYNRHNDQVLLRFVTCQGTWASSTSSNWGVGPWSPGCVPGISGLASDADAATLADVAAANIDIALTPSVLLHDLDFTSAITSYSINGPGTITFDAVALASDPQLSVTAGTHFINAPIILSYETIFSLSGGILTLGTNASITGIGGLIIGEGVDSGRLINYGMMNPASLLIEGSTIENHTTISPQGNWSIVEQNGVSSPATVINYATLGTNTSNLTFSGGMLSNFAQVLTNNYTQSGPASLKLNVASTFEYASLRANGSAILGGSLLVNALSNFSMTAGETINLITATNGISSTFAQVDFQNFPASLIPSLVYSQNAVQLDVRETIKAHAGGTAQIHFKAISQHNQILERKCLQMRDRAFQAEKKNLAIHALSEDQLYAQNEEIQHRQHILTDNLIEKSKGKQPWSLYVGPIASFGTIKSEEKQPGFGYHSIGALAGFDYACITDNRPYDLGLGVLFDYKRTSGVGKNHWGSFSSNAIYGSFYGTVVPKSIPNLSFDSIIGAGTSWNHFYRHAGIDDRETAVGKPLTSAFDLLFDAEYTIFMPHHTRLIPMANVQYIYQRQAKFTEREAGIYNVKVDAQTAQSASSFLGARLNTLFVATNYQLRAEIDTGWQREYLDNHRNASFTAFQVTNQSTNATVTGAGRNSWIIGLDLLSTIYDIVQIECSADAKWNRLFFDASFYLGIGSKF